MTRLFKPLKLPSVTAYLIAGVLIGPYCLGALNIHGVGFASMEQVGRLSLVSEVALGFIAFSIGNEFRLEDLKKTGKQALVIGILQALCATLLVDFALLGIHMLLPDKLSAAQAITLGAIASATAPAATLMVIRQYKATGPVCEMLLPVVAMDDALGLMAYAISISVAQAMVSAAAILARTTNPQAADFELDRAYFAQMLALSDGLSDGGFARGYVQLQIDSANLRAAVRTRRMAKDADFLKTALIPGGTIGTDRVLAAFDSAEALTALYGNTWLGNAAAAGAAAMSGGALTAFELLCDNALMDYIRAAKLRSFGAAHVSAYLAAMENETTAARMILTGRLAGLQPAVIRERLRETYA